MFSLSWIIYILKLFLKEKVKGHPGPLWKSQYCNNYTPEASSGIWALLGEPGVIEKLSQLKHDQGSIACFQVESSKLLEHQGCVHMHQQNADKM